MRTADAAIFAIWVVWWIEQDCHSAREGGRSVIGLLEAEKCYVPAHRPQIELKVKQFLIAKLNRSADSAQGLETNFRSLVWSNL